MLKRVNQFWSNLICVCILAVSRGYLNCWMKQNLGILPQSQNTIVRFYKKSSPSILIKFGHKLALKNLTNFMHSPMKMNLRHRLRKLSLKIVTKRFRLNLSKKCGLNQCANRTLQFASTLENVKINSTAVIGFKHKPSHSITIW